MSRAFISDTLLPAPLIEMLVLGVPRTWRALELCAHAALQSRCLGTVPLRGIQGPRLRLWVTAAGTGSRAAVHSGANCYERNMEIGNPLHVRGFPGRFTISRLEEAKETNTHGPIKN